MNNVDFEKIAREAFEAAKIAEQVYITKNGEPAYCGFAWVNIKPGTSKFARFMKEHYGARKSYYGGIDIWNPGGSCTQSMDVKEHGASAFADVLKKYGFKAYAMSRPD